MKILKSIIFAITLLLFSLQAFATVIKQVQISGNSRVISDYIQSLMSAEAGEDYTESQLNADLKTIFATDLFEKVDGSFDNGVVSIKVVESPLIDNITFSGNSKLKNDVLMKELSSQRRTPFSQNRLNLDVQRITELYYRSGFFAATVNFEIIRKEYNRLDIVFNIQEGRKTLIDTVIFMGNRAFPAGELKSQMLTKEARWWRMFNAGDVYDINRIMYDGELLRQFYLENGYPNFAVLSNFSELSLHNGFIITYVLDEGERYRFGDVSLNIKLLDLLPHEEEILQQITLIDRRDWFRNSTLQRQVLRIKDKINSLGYQFVNVEPQMIFNDVSKRVDIVFVVDEADKLFVHQANITGNRRTRDYVIRRELKFAEQDAFDQDRINMAQRNLQQTGYFSSVNIQDSPADYPGKVNLDINVEEVSTGSISVGGGFSTVDRLQFEASYAETNLFGTGNYFGVSLNLSQMTKMYNVTLSNPYFLGRELFASASVYRRDSGASNLSRLTLYQNLEQGINTSIGYRLTDNFSQRWGYGLFYRNIYNVDPNVSQSIRELAGTSFVSTVNHTLAYNSTDNSIFATRGIDASLTTEYAGLFGDSDYIKNTYRSVWYYSVMEDVVFSALGSVGVIEGLNGQSVKIIDKYNLGGPTLRGFKIGANYGGIGPMDAKTGESLGGKYMFRGSFQLETPMPGVKQYGLLVYTFSDFGTATDFSNNPEILDSRTIRVSAGVGLSWRSPAGVISLDLGFPVKKDPMDATEMIFLNFGTRI
ncbi:MAG: outer membrane protein assembly factor BamA [Alphaproteobacteria bacterium]|jgi:outer membrane protein insertion porin family|nr:outer membrane protein assembly factor BamA [Alphaproteobacteria bacterium]